MAKDKEDIDEITTTTGVGSGMRKDSLPNKGKTNPDEDEKEGLGCICPACSAEIEKSGDTPCSKEVCPSCGALMKKREKEE